MTTTDLPAPTSGPGVFFDGRTSARQDVRVTLGPAGLQMTDDAGRVLADWPYDEIDELNAPANVLRLGRRHDPVLARLEVFDAPFAHAIDLRAESVDRTGAIHRRQRLHVVGWTILATLALVAVSYWGIPTIADRLAPAIPLTVERRMGEAVNMQVRGQLDTHNAGAAFDCGNGENEQAGRVALEKMIKRLEGAAGLGLPLRASVVRRPEANAIALPGGQIYVFQGLIEKADNPDEVAGVIAHEIGHVAHRDNTKGMLQGAGLSFLFGMLLGDFVGGGAVVYAAKTVLQSSYSREAETAADRYGAELMKKVHGDPRALATMLAKIGGATEPGMKILLDHPETKARVAAIGRIAPNGPTIPFLDAPEWAALKRICAG
ncbi:M48 family metallopeptidase [Microbacteriaceae bacterium K1510]|nr:M48 family metallopeptidase [Microbacteriaceae bacterium K1510]